MRALPSALVVLAFAAALVASAAPVTADQASAPAFRVIVHPSNATPSVERRFLEDAFLKKITRWRNDTVIRPVDQSVRSPVRRSFSELAMRRSVSAVEAFWQQRIFSGADVPPPRFDGDAEVVRYVLMHEGAVGYVSPTAELRGAKVIDVRW